MGASRVNFFYDQLLIKEPGLLSATVAPRPTILGDQRPSGVLYLINTGRDPEEVGVEYVCGSHGWPEFSPYHFVDGAHMREPDCHHCPTSKQIVTSTELAGLPCSPETA